MHQMTINLEKSLVQQFPSFMDVIRASVYDCGIPFKNIAVELDMTVSELSRRLSPSDDLPFKLDCLPLLISVTKDYRPIYWLVESFVENADTKRNRAVNELTKLMPQIHALLNQVGK